MTKEAEPLLTPREREFLAQNPTAEIVDTASDPAAHSELVGVEGWLGFLAISLVFLGPLVAVFMTVIELSDVKALNPDAAKGPQWTGILIASWVATLVYCAISIFAGHRLFKHRVPRTVPIVIACLWILGPLFGILALFSLEGDTRAGGEVARSFMTTAIWTAYLLRSKRVKNTYRWNVAKVFN